MANHTWPVGGGDEPVPPVENELFLEIPDAVPIARRPIAGESDESNQTTDAVTLITSLGWYGYGEMVIDRIAEVTRCEAASIFCSTDEVPSPAEVRSRIGLAPYLPVEITDEAPRRICTLDDVVWLESGELYDLRRCDFYTPQRLEIVLMTYDLLAGDLLRLGRIMRDYPEISAPTPLADFVSAGIRHLESLSHRFDDVQSLFLQYETISRWRRP